MADYDNILYEKQRRGVLITLNRPERLNAISPELERELHEALDEAEADPEVRAIVLPGQGGHFHRGMTSPVRPNSSGRTRCPRTRAWRRISITGARRTARTCATSCTCGS